jgi:hypothetical protein
VSVPKEPKNLGELLAASGALRPDPNRVSLSQWRSAVGDRIAARSRPGKLVEGLLTVVVASSPWAQELSLLSDAIVRRMGEQGLMVRRLRFSIGHVEPITSAEPPHRVKRRELPPALRARLAKITDPELRRAIEEAATLSEPSKS